MKFRKPERRRGHTNSNSLGLSLFLILINAVPCFSQDAAEDGFFPRGLVAKYTAGKSSITRIDDNIQLKWKNQSPDQRLTADSFSATWHGMLLIQDDADFRFHAFLQGDIEMTVNGASVLQASHTKPEWVSSKSVPLVFGETPISVAFKKTADEAVVKLFWSSDRFSLEPLPAHLLFHEREDQQLKLIRQGAEQFDAYRCNRCHRHPNESIAPLAPDLSTTRSGLSENWIVDHLSQRSPMKASERMPRFRISKSDATLIARYLHAQSESPKLIKPKPSKDADKNRDDGNRLVHSVGCLACHSHGELGNHSIRTAGDLSRIGEKRSHEWLLTWLESPKLLNADHRMPVFQLSSQERQQIGLFLSKPSGGISTAENSSDNSKQMAPLTKTESLAARDLLGKFQCTACHTIPGTKSRTSFPGALVGQDVRWDRSCIGEESRFLRKNQPHYSGVDAAAMRAFVESRTGTLLPVSDFEAGRNGLARNNCTACHKRGNAAGITQTAGEVSSRIDSLKGQSSGMIPPTLSAVGDKLFDDYLTQAVAGKIEERRLPWLLVRMPKFSHAKNSHRQLVEYLSASDRIPENAPDRPQMIDLVKDFGAEDMLAGRELTGAHAFNCVACHRFGEYAPKGVALGTRGSDLIGIGKRLRADYFLRWTTSPLRISPGMEMPSYNKPRPGFFHNDVTTQIAAIWYALNDPNFRAPASTSAVEQFVSIGPDEPLRVIRDVFTNPESSTDSGKKTNSRSANVPRAFGIGFNNRHSVLLDLATASIRAWTIGDFAQQRTQGKSWFWDLGGAAIITGFNQDSNIAIRRVSDGKIFEPVRENHAAIGKLQYRTSKNEVVLQYQLKFAVQEKVISLGIIDSFKSLGASGPQSRADWQRTVVTTSRRKDFDVIYRHPKTRSAIGHPQIVPHTLSGASPVPWQKLPHGGRFVPLVQDDENPNNLNAIAIDFRSGLSVVRPQPGILSRPDRPVVTSPITTAPGFVGQRLPVSTSIMPTALAWDERGNLAFTSLKGHVFQGVDTDDDGLEDRLRVIESGLASPFGLWFTDVGLNVAHKPEILQLNDLDGDGSAETRTVLASGWGYTDDYHDWTTAAPLRSPGTSESKFFVALGSNYSQKGREKSDSRWRGMVLSKDSSAELSPMASGLRYPMGIAVGPNGGLFVSDQQGVQNCFNEINYIAPDGFYGVPGLYDESRSEFPVAIRIPHPWTRSVNGIFFVPVGVKAQNLKPFAGHGIGCEYNNRFLIRFTTQTVRGVQQGAVYPFTKSTWKNEAETFLGPICGGVSPDGDIYIGSIHDSGWIGGQNTGEIVKLQSSGQLPNGIREIRATHDGFEIEFLKPVNRQKAIEQSSYSLSAYTRVWKGGYNTEDSGRHRPEIIDIALSEDRKTVHLSIASLRKGYLYDISCGEIGTQNQPQLWPAIGHYTLNEIPADKNAKKGQPQ